MPEIRHVVTLDELDEVLERSRRSPTWIFKHSLVCPVSSEAWRQFREFVEGHPETATEFSVIEIQKARPVSDAAAERTRVRHASPQAILIHDGRVLWDGSHWAITSTALRTAESEIPASRAAAGEI